MIMFTSLMKFPMIYKIISKDCSSFTEDMLCGTIKNKEALSKAVLLYYTYMGI